ncbi:MAG: hypothetical protein JKY50_05900 [Oleispira sp.]|nr:hypothetical protein [Oleispira sp.]MBL4880549.1 hypothetical protein [Oleispira sp.]
MAQIQLRQDNFKIDYKNERLAALFSQQPSDCDFDSSAVLGLVSGSELISAINNARQTLLIACDQLKEIKLIEALKQKADSGVRIYLLLGDDKSNQMAIDTLSGRCLVRSGVSQAGALILVDHATTKSQGLLLMDQKVLITSDDKAWSIHLESQQIDDSFRSFCKLFWENSENEYLQQNQRQNKVNHPDGEVVTNHSRQLFGTLKDCLNETLQSLSRVSEFTVDDPGHSFQLLLNTSAKNIAKVARKGVSLTDNIIPTLLLSESGNWLLPNSPNFDIVNWCLRLSSVQSEMLGSLYDQAVEDAAWQYKSEVTMGDLPNKQSVRFSNQPGLIQSVEDNRTKRLKDINTDTIDIFLNDSAKSLASKFTNYQHDYMAHEIDYHVAIHPPYCPPEAKKDSLYNDWENAEENWQDKLTSLKYQQKNIDDKQAGFADRLKGFLKGFLLGQDQAVKQLNQELDTLQSWSVTKATPAGRIEKNKRYEDLQVSIRQRGNDTEEKLDEAQQNHSWEGKRAELLKSLNEKMDIVSARKEEQNLLISKEGEGKLLVDAAFCVAWKESVKSLSNGRLEETKVKDLEPEQFLPDVLPEKEEERAVLLESAKLECMRKKREALNSMMVEQAEQWKGIFNSKIWKKHYSTFSKALEDHHLSLKKIEREIQNADVAVNGCQSDLYLAQSMLSTHGERFIYQPNKDSKAFEKQLGLKEKALQSGSFTWPDQELPAECTELRSLNKQRFLIIKDTEQLEHAKKDAARLSAKIVCDKERVNA